MVAYENSKPFSVIETALAGGAAGAVTRAISQPLDVLKIRFQLQLEPLQHGSKYSSMAQATKSIVLQEGISTLWSGHLPAQLLSISFGIIQFSAYEKLIKLCKNADNQAFDKHKHAINFACGGLAATMATIVSFPLDTVRTRLIAQEKTQKAYKGFVSALVAMVRTEGPLALFKGLTPTLGQIVPNAGIQFTLYKFTTENIVNKIDIFKRNTSSSSSISPTLLGNLLAGTVSGIVAKTVVYPLDLVKKRLQIQGFQNHRKSFGKQMFCTGVLHCVKLTISKEGLLALYKGYVPSLAKAGVVSALYFAVYDEIKYIILRSR